MKPSLTSLATDLLMVIGFLALVYGLWLAWHPLGFIVGGLLVTPAAFFLNYSSARASRREK